MSTSAPRRTPRRPGGAGRPGHVTTGPYAPPAPAHTRTVVSADGTALHVEEHGPAEAPAVVLVHGWTCSTAFWAAQLRDLAPDHRVIAYDLRGHGRSQVPDGPAGYGTRQLADDLEAVLGATLAPGRKALVVGHSMGGMTVMAAARRPALREHAAAVLLADTGSHRLNEASTVVPMRAGRLRTRLTRQILCSRLPLGPETAFTRRMLAYGIMGRGATPGMRVACARIIHACPRVVRYRWGDVLARLDVQDGLRALDLPTAVVVGTADKLTPLPGVRELAATLPRPLGLTELPGLGHMTPVEDPGTINALIRALTADHVPAATGPDGTGTATTGPGTTGPRATGTDTTATGTTGPDTTQEAASA
jgi:pimeloyl-ACP methyl ester carboxylesterase